MPVGAPVESKISVLSGVTGTEKLAWFSTLKNSARNCTLKFSEILRTRLFLKIEKSRFVSPGPIRILRPALPRRLKHCGKTAGTGGSVGSLGWMLGGNGLQFAFQKAKSGALGTAKHWVLM